MKRSEINAIINNAIKLAKEKGFLLPPFAYWTPEEIMSKGAEYDEFFDNKLGWDITDFGKGDFRKYGLTMVTIRNGNYYNEKYIKPYAEKILIAQEGQITPYHYHAKKMEDIINRGGGNLIVKMYNSVSPKEFADTDVMVTKDGRSYFVKAGEEVCVAPGESITLHPGVFHCFWGEVGKGPVLLGEVSMVNDDYSDNYFYDEIGRFPTIEEDEKAEYLLSDEYDKWRKKL